MIFHSETQFHRDHTIPTAGWIWVFGSNLAGIHGKGAAKVAHINFQFPYGVGKGRAGLAYAVATKKTPSVVLSLEEVKANIDEFCAHALSSLRSKDRFYLTRVGCDLAGFADAEIAPLFAPLASRGRISFPDVWKPLIAESLAQADLSAEANTQAAY